MSAWRAKRQISYLFSAVLVIALIVGGIYWWTRPAATCFDGVLNQDEVGVDCGGQCERICPMALLPLKTLWSRAVAITPGMYNAVALIENPNSQAEIKDLNYRFKLLDSAGQVLLTREGKINIGTDEKIVIFEGGLAPVAGEIARAFIEFPNDPKWLPKVEERPLLRVSQKSFIANETPKLEAIITNESVLDLENVQVVTVLSDAEGNIISTSATVLERLARLSSYGLTFTWPAPFSAVPTFIDFYPRIIGR